MKNENKTQLDAKKAYPLNVIINAVKAITDRNLKFTPDSIKLMLNQASQCNESDVESKILCMVEEAYSPWATEQVSLILEKAKIVSAGNIALKWADNHTENEKIMLRFAFNLIKDTSDAELVFSFIDHWSGPEFFTVVGDKVMTYHPREKEWTEAYKGEGVEFAINRFNKTSKKGFYRVK